MACSRCFFSALCWVAARGVYGRGLYAFIKTKVKGLSCFFGRDKSDSVVIRATCICKAYM